MLNNNAANDILKSFYPRLILLMENWNFSMIDIHSIEHETYIFINFLVTHLLFQFASVYKNKNKAI